MSRSWPHHPTDPADPSRHCQLALPEPRVGWLEKETSPFPRRTHAMQACRAQGEGRLQDRSGALSTGSPMPDNGPEAWTSEPSAVTRPQITSPGCACGPLVLSDHRKLCLYKVLS